MFVDNEVNKLLKLSGKVTTLSKGKLSIPNRGTNVNTVKSLIVAAAIINF